MVETLLDLDLAHGVRSFAQDFILETVHSCNSPSSSPGEETKKRRRQEVPAPETPLAGRMSQEKRRRITPPATPAAPRARDPAPLHPSPQSSARRSRGEDTPMGRYRRKREEEAERDSAHMRTKGILNMCGFKVVVSSRTAPPSTTEKPAPPPLPSVDTSKVRKGLEDLERSMAEYRQFMAENTL